jgi:hypothetical protein
MKRTLIAIAFLAFPPEGLAEKFALGSMDLKPCSKGKERATLFLEISAPNLWRVQEELKDCAEHSVAAATLPALLKNLPVAEHEFWAEFKVCTRYTEWVNANLSIERSCRN